MTDNFNDNFTNNNNFNIEKNNTNISPPPVAIAMNNQILIQTNNKSMDINQQISRISHEIMNVDSGVFFLYFFFFIFLLIFFLVSYF